jgi:hypothetical protein
MSIKGFVNNHSEYQDFLVYIKARIEVVHKTLEQSTEPFDIYRCQGEIKALRRLLSLRDEINNRDT